MIIKRRTEHRVRMGEFESVVISAEIEMDSADFNEPASECVEFANAFLDEALENDIKELQEISDRGSYIREWRNS